MHWRSCPPGEQKTLMENQQQQQMPKHLLKFLQTTMPVKACRKTMAALERQKTSTRDTCGSTDLGTSSTEAGWFLYVQGSKHEGRLVQCETCGDQFLVGVYKENKQRTAYANDDIDAHACFYEDNAGEPARQEPKDPVTPALEGFKV